MSREFCCWSMRLRARERAARDRLRALESALAAATKRLFDEEDVDIRVSSTARAATTTPSALAGGSDEAGLQEPGHQVILSDARDQIADIEVDEHIEEQLPRQEFGRRFAQDTKQVILQKIRDAEREQLLTEFLARGDEVSTAPSRDGQGRLHRGDRQDRGAAAAQRDDRQGEPAHRRPRARLRRQDRPHPARPGGDPVAHLARVPDEAVRARVRRSSRGCCRSKSAARDPGYGPRSRCDNDRRIDPIGTCVGMRGSRVQAVTNELSGERVDIVLWSEDPAQFVIGALAPANVSSIVVDEERHAMDVVSTRRTWRSPSAAAARTCAWPRTEPAGRSTS